MLAVFLPALNFRGNRSPYLWWFYKFVTELGKDAGYVCGDEYFIDPSRHRAIGREEANESLAKRCNYRVPDTATLAGLVRDDIPLDVWDSLEVSFPSNPLGAFKHFCLEEDVDLSNAIAVSLDRIETECGKVEAVITCVNCATLTTLCRVMNIPLVHFELGPLRAPNFLPTTYFDFSGVNGGTEARARFDAAKGSIIADELCDVDVLKSLFATRKLSDARCPDIDLGLALQIEDDSNVICYSNGFSSLSLLNDAKIKLSEKLIRPPVLIRSHPGSMFSVRDLSPDLAVDRSETAVEFILRCKRIHTINSSVAVESLLLGREVAVFGESAFGFCVDSATHRSNDSALSFFLLNYLVPWDIAFSTEYIRWRLKMPTEDSIRKTHVECFMRERIEFLESRVSELEQALDMKNSQLAQLKSSFSWRLTFPLRAVYAIVWRIVKWPRQ